MHITSLPAGQVQHSSQSRKAQLLHAQAGPVCQVVSKAPQFQPQNISNIAWAFASWNHQPSRAMSAKMESHLVEHMPQYTAQVSLQL